MAGLKILIAGSGGREYALAWKLRQSPQCGEIFCAPGNGGMEAFGTCVDIAAENGTELASFARHEGIDLAVIGPEAALAAGVADRLREAGIAVFGPSAQAAKIESSKIFTRQLAAKAGIPGPDFWVCHTAEEAETAIRQSTKARVIKQDGLAAGKGVVVASSESEALAAAKKFLSKGEILIEEKMVGQEASFFALAAGSKAVPFGSAQDYKRVGEGDTGLNTGGMGAVSPSPRFTTKIEEDVMAQVILPALAALEAKDTPFYGVLYAGLMFDEKNTPRLVEFNARFGDPECQLLMLRLESDLLPALMAVAQGNLPEPPLWHNARAAGVVLASKGYPEAYETGYELKGLGESLPEGSVCFHAATEKRGESFFSSGGRVLMAAATGADYQAALNKANQAAQQLSWEQGFYRADIGYDVVGK